MTPTPTQARRGSAQGPQSQNGLGRPLQRLEPSLPSTAYYEPDRFRHELEAIWHREWICVGRNERLTRAGHYQVYEFAGQSIIVVRHETGVLKAFHNTCRHRGSLLCESEHGRFEKNRIVCPYHAWAYSLEGELTHTPWRLESADFDMAEFKLYEVGVGEWGANVFINLQPESGVALSDYLGALPDLFANWQLQHSISAHRYRKVVRCNWKIFWENFTECYHCPGIHPELCRVVPRYSGGVIRASDDPAWDPHAGPDPDTEPRLAPGMVTWSDDGLTRLPHYRALTAEERALGQTFGVLMPSCFFAAHVDFVRFGHILPLSPERTEVVIECLFPEETLQDPSNDISSTTSFIDRLTEQDLRVCELNQRGLHSRRHQAGVLVPQEYYTHGFHRWVRARLEADTEKGIQP